MSEVAPSPGRLRSTRKGSKLSPREKAFVEAYCGDARLDSIKAATLAGAADPQSMSWRMLRRPRIRAAIDRRIARRVAGPQELMGELTDIATAPWRDFITLQYGLDGEVVSATLNLGEKLKAIDLLQKAQGAYIDPLTRALGQLAMGEVNRMLRAKRLAAKKARLSRRHPKLLAQGSTPPVVDEVEAQVIEQDDMPGQGKATEDD